jgi:uncharacterized protein
MRAATVGAMLFLAVAVDAGHAISLPTTQVTVETTSGPRQLRVEVASDLASQQRGLMFRHALAANAGMLFDFHNSALLSFWMKDTLLSLDMLFIRSDGTIASIASNTIPLSTTPIRSAEPVRAVLEINGGRAYELGIRPGDRVRATIFHDEN